MCNERICVVYASKTVEKKRIWDRMVNGDNAGRDAGEKDYYYFCMRLRLGRGDCRFALMLVASLGWWLSLANEPRFQFADNSSNHDFIFFLLPPFLTS